MPVSRCSARGPRPRQRSTCSSVFKHGTRIELRERIRGARERAFEDVDLGVGRERAQLARFGERRDEKAAAAFAQQRRATRSTPSP